MNFERLEALAEKTMGKRKSHIEREIGAVYFHGKRVAVGVLQLREKLFSEDGSHDEILRCAGLFHDIGKGIEPHPQTGALLVRKLLNFPFSREIFDEKTEYEDSVIRRLTLEGEGQYMIGSI